MDQQSALGRKRQPPFPDALFPIAYNSMLRVLNSRRKWFLLTFGAVCLIVGTAYYFMLGPAGWKDGEISDIRIVPLPPEPKGIEAVLFVCRWVAFAPSRHPTGSPDQAVSAELSLREDLRVLHRAGFDGLVTYGAGDGKLPQIAKEEGFKAVLLGVWNPASTKEKGKTELAAKHEIVKGLIIGNEGLMTKRYDMTTLTNAMAELKAATGKPVSTTEVIEWYYSKPALIEVSDFLAPNAHPYFHAKKAPDPAVTWTVDAYRNLVKKAGEKKVLFKEVGLPTDGEPGLSEAAQAEYYAKLMQTDVRFVFFEAFDQANKRHLPIEPHWGLFRTNREPKEVVARCLKAAGP